MQPRLWEMLASLWPHSAFSRCRGPISWERLPPRVTTGNVMHVMSHIDTIQVGNIVNAGECYRNLSPGLAELKDSGTCYLGGAYNDGA